MTHLICLGGFNLFDVVVSRENAVNIHQMLSEACKERKVRSIGIDTIRESIVMKAFDIVISQNNNDMKQRAQILQKIQNEASHTIDTWKQLVNQSKIYSLKKAQSV